MSQVVSGKHMRLVVPGDVHEGLRVEAARRGVSLAVCVVELVRERLALGGSVVPRSVPVKPRVDPPVRVVDEVEVRGEWKPVVGLSKSDQVRRGRK